MRRVRILLCDDQPAILTLLQKLLEPHYHVVGTAEDGHSLVAAAQALRPDIVVTDINMPHVNGLDATRELRKHLPGCRVIVHSSHDEPEVMAAAFAAGASGYLIKGSTNALESSIRTVIESVWALAKPPVLAQDSRSHVRKDPLTTSREASRSTASEPVTGRRTSSY